MRGLLHHREWILLSFATLFAGLIGFLSLAHNLARAQPNRVDANDCLYRQGSGSWVGHCPERVPLSGSSYRTGLMVGGMTDLHSVEGILNFDPEYLEIIQTRIPRRDPANDPCAIAPALAATFDNNAGTLNFSAVFDPPLADGCTVFLIDWRIKAISPAEVAAPTFSLHTMINSQGQEIPHHVKPPEGWTITPTWTPTPTETPTWTPTLTHTPTWTPTATETPVVYCTPPPCPNGRLVCGNPGGCPGGCGAICQEYTDTPTVTPTPTGPTPTYTPTLTPTPTGTPPSSACVISGQVMLQGHTDPSGQRPDYGGTAVMLSTQRACPSNFTFSSSWDWPGIISTKTDPLGNFALDSAGKPCLCLFAFKHGYLTALGRPPMEGLVVKAPITLFGGDVIRDDAINVFDLALIAARYGSVGDPVCDVNGDNKCDIYDLAITAGNMDRPRGPQPWP